MRIVVLVKEVPDTYGDRVLHLETGLTERGNGGQVVDEIGERALECALSYADAHPDSTVSVLSMGPTGATSSIRKCLAMGAANAVHVVDPRLVGADLGLTAEVLATALERMGFDLILAGNQSTDGMSGMLPAMIAERLSLPNATSLSDVRIDPDGVSGHRVSDAALVEVAASLPAIVSVTEQVPDPRFPTFKGIVAAKKKSIETLDLDDLGVNADGVEISRTIMTAVVARPQRMGGVKITDEGDAASELVAFLAKNQLV